MKIILGADHGGYNTKEKHQTILQAQGYEILDAGAHHYDDQDDFPDFVSQAVALFRQYPASKIILWCRSGIGVSLSANRHPDIYCGLGFNVQQLIRATSHNHLNALALASDYLSFDLQQELINAFLTQKPANEAKYLRRLQKINHLR